MFSIKQIYVYYIENVCVGVTYDISKRFLKKKLTKCSVSKESSLNKVLSYLGKAYKVLSYLGKANKVLSYLGKA